MSARVIVIQHEDDAPPGQLAGALAARGLDAAVVRPDRGEPVPATAEDAAGVVVLGGFMGAHDDADFPWLPAVRDLLRAAAAGPTPALGICLGAQLSAVALGGTVARRPGGYEIAWVDVAPAAGAEDDPVAGAMRDGGRLLLWHQDAFVAPAEAQPLLAAGQSFRVGSLWAFQHHPEVDERVVAMWCDDPNGPAQLAQAGTTRDVVLAGAREHAGHGRRLLDAWCAVVAERAAAVPAT